MTRPKGSPNRSTQDKLDRLHAFMLSQKPITPTVRQCQAHMEKSYNATRWLLGRLLAQGKAIQGPRGEYIATRGEVDWSEKYTVTVGDSFQGHKMFHSDTPRTPAPTGRKD